MHHRLSGSPVSQARSWLVFRQGDVIKEGVAAVDQPGDAASGDVLDNSSFSAKCKVLRASFLRASGGTGNTPRRSEGEIGCFRIRLLVYSYITVQTGDASFVFGFAEVMSGGTFEAAHGKKYADRV